MRAICAGLAAIREGVRVVEQRSRCSHLSHLARAWAHISARVLLEFETPRLTRELPEKVAAALARIRPGALGKPKRGVGRLVLETGVPVVPVAVIGTEAVRRGLRIRPHKVRIRAGRPLRFPQVDESKKVPSGTLRLSGAILRRT